MISIRQIILSRQYNHEKSVAVSHPCDSRTMCVMISHVGIGLWLQGVVSSNNCERCVVCIGSKLFRVAYFVHFVRSSGYGFQPPRPNPKRIRPSPGLPHLPHCWQVCRNRQENRQAVRKGTRVLPQVHQEWGRCDRHHEALQTYVCRGVLSCTREKHR